jgi:hypothetical protein
MVKQFRSDLPEMGAIPNFVFIWAYCRILLSDVEAV